MMSASEGCHGKADIVREVARILYYKSVPNADNGGGGQKVQKLCRCHQWKLPHTSSRACWRMNFAQRSTLRFQRAA